MDVKNLNVFELRDVLPTEITDDELITLMYFVMALYINDSTKALRLLIKATEHVHDVFEDVRSYCNDGEIVQ